MFNIGLIELLIIIFFILILVKPKDFPKIFQNIGLFYRKINQYISNFKYEFSNLEVKEKKQKLKKKINLINWYVIFRPF